jgi:DNA replication factor GINS
MSEKIEDITINDVHNLLRKEIHTAILQDLQHDAYQKMAVSLGNLKGQGFEGIEAKIRDLMVELLSESVKLLIEVRQQKMRYGSEPLDYSKLTDEEKYILDGHRESEDRLQEVVAATTKGRPKVLELISSRMRSKQVIVRFVKPMEQFIGVDMSKYGPFQEEDVAALPLENARPLVQGGVAVQVHTQL